MDKAEVNQHLQFATEICANDMNISVPEKEDKVQVMTNYKLSFLDMKISWSPEGGLQFSVFRKKGQKLKYVRMGIIHTPGTLRPIPSGVLNRLTKITL